MKKRIVSAAILIIVAAIVFLNIGILSGVPYKSRSFALYDYADALVNPKNQDFTTFGLIAKSDQALKAARLLFSQRYSYEPEDKFFSDIGWQIRHDKVSGAWFVKSYSLNPFSDAPVYNVIFSMGGTVLAVWKS